MSEQLLLHLLFMAKHAPGCSLESILTLILMELRIPANHDGAVCLRRAILLLHKNPQISFTKDLYPQISLNGSGFQAEQAIRATIKLAWLKRDDAVWSLYFFGIPHGLKPSNKQFIETISLILGIYEDLRNSYVPVIASIER